MILFPKQYFIKKYLLRMQGDLIAAFQYLNGDYEKEEDRLFSGVCGYTTRGGSFKLKEGRFCLDIRNKPLQ